MRIGFSKDIHKLKKSSNGMMIGLVKIPSNYEVIAISDGDVLVHVIFESIIGALGLGDLGLFFPENDQSSINLSGAKMLKKLKDILLNDNAHIINIDSTIVLEEPKLFDYIPEMKRNIAKLLDIKGQQISIKATRFEDKKTQKIEAYCVSLISKG